MDAVLEQSEQTACGVVLRNQAISLIDNWPTGSASAIAIFVRRDKPA
jgi:hypothetical protein